MAYALPGLAQDFGGFELDRLARCEHALAILTG